MTMFRIIISVILSVSIIGCSRTHSVYNVENHALPSTLSKMDNQEITKKIISAAANKGWNCHEAGSHKLLCNLKVRVHEANIAIKYNNQDFSIYLVGAKNLKNEHGKIHRNYNKWIRLLEKEIYRELAA